jgi:hypothetical protein
MCSARRDLLQVEGRHRLRDQVRRRSRAVERPGLRGPAGSFGAVVGSSMDPAQAGRIGGLRTGPFIEMFDPAAKSNSISLIGMMGVGAMAAGNTALAARAYRFVLDATYSADPVGAVAAYTYYNATVGLLAALTMSGNFNNF